MSQSYRGYRRPVVGAHYGWSDYLVQRISGAYIVFYTVVFLLRVMVAKGPMTYQSWAGVFSPQWMKMLTFTLIVALIWHAWIGIVSIWLDYGKPTWVRLTLDALSAVWLLACAGWALQVLWRL